MAAGNSGRQNIAALKINDNFGSGENLLGK